MPGEGEVAKTYPRATVANRAKRADREVLKRDLRGSADRLRRPHENVRAAHARIFE